VTYRTQDPAALQTRIAELEAENAELRAKLEARSWWARLFCKWSAWEVTQRSSGNGADGVAVHLMKVRRTRGKESQERSVVWLDGERGRWHWVDTGERCDSSNEMVDLWNAEHNRQRANEAAKAAEPKRANRNAEAN
jgi:hypothetical protein